MEGNIEKIRERAREGQGSNDPGGFTIKFESNGGSFVPDQRVNEGGTVSQPPDPFRSTPWAFIDWYIDRDLTEVYDFALPVFTDLILYARWIDMSLPRHFVFFHSNGGSDVDSQQIIQGERAIRPYDPVRSGWVFDDWYADIGLQIIFHFTNPVTSLTNLYARWIPAVVIFNKNGGDTEAEPNTKTIIPPAITLDSLPVPPTLFGYTFNGWNTATDGSGTVFGWDTTFIGNMTVYAQWVPSVESVNLNKQTLTLVYGEEEILIAAVNPAIAYNKNVNWSSNTPNIASVDQNGKVTTHALGTAVITVTTEDGGKTDECIVTVIVPFITINEQPVSITNVISGSISGGLTVTANVAGGAVLSYQWFNNTTNSNIGGTAVNGAVNANFMIPLVLELGTYYYYVEINATGDALPVRSNAAVVFVHPPIEMVWVPGGNFELGKNLGTGGGEDVTPVSTVTLTGFHIGKYSITQEQYLAVMGNNPSWFTTANGRPPGEGESQNRRPVENVNWYEAIVFCNRLSYMTGLKPVYEMLTADNIDIWSTNPDTWGTVPSGSDPRWNAVRKISGSTGFRLPTEAQWEYAAKGGNSSPGGFTFAGSDNVNEVAWYIGNSGNITREVGRLAPNNFGLYDMSGNVWEWCWDWRGNYTSGNKTDPTGAVSGSNRVVRGGSWNGLASNTRSVFRFIGEPGFRHNSFGFRVVYP